MQYFFHQPNLCVVWYYSLEQTNKKSLQLTLIILEYHQNAAKIQKCIPKYCRLSIHNDIVPVFT